MTTGLPPYFFRVRENGAFVFRVLTDDRMRRIDMDQIAMVNTRNGEIKPHGDRQLAEEDVAAIRDWMADRAETLAMRDIDDIHRTVDHMNMTAHWVQTRATDAQLDLVSDALLLAMHDLRSVLVRKKAERLMRSVDGDKDD